MLVGVERLTAEAFSFALAVVLTPAVVLREFLRLLHVEKELGSSVISSSLSLSLLGAVFSFLAGLLALKWLSQWLEAGRWYLFGVYCLNRRRRRLLSAPSRLLNTRQIFCRHMR